MIRPRPLAQSDSPKPNDELRIYFFSNGVTGGMPGSIRSRLNKETYFNIDWRGCGALGTAEAGYSISAADLHRFAGHPIVHIPLQDTDLRRWHNTLRAAFMPKDGGYSIDEITRTIAQASRLLTRLRIPTTLKERFNPDTEIDRWYGDSHAHNGKYLPQVMFRAATPEQMLAGEFSTGNTWFASDGWDAHVVGDGSELAEAVLSIQNPLILAPDTQLKDAIGDIPIPAGYDGLIIRNEDGSCSAAAVADPSQFRLTGATHPEMESWFQSWMQIPPVTPARPPAPHADPEPDFQ